MQNPYQNKIAAWGAVLCSLRSVRKYVQTCSALLAIQIPAKVPNLDHTAAQPVPRALLPM